MSRHIAVELDFVAGPRAARIGRVLLIAGAAAAVAAVVDLADGWQRREDQGNAVAAAIASRAARNARPADPALVRAAAVLSHELRLPWGQLLSDLESAQSRDVAVLVVEPVAAQKLVRITGDARNSEAMLDYVAEIGKRSLGDVVLTSHQVQAQAPGAPVRFQLQARWFEGRAAAPTGAGREVTALAPTAATAAGSELVP